MILVIFPKIGTSETETERNPTVLEDKMPKCKCPSEYKVKPTDEWRKTTLISRTGRSVQERTSFG